MTCVPPSHPLDGCRGIANVLLLKTLSEVSHDTIPGVHNPSRKAPQVLYRKCVFAGMLVLKYHPRRPEPIIRLIRSVSNIQNSQVKQTPRHDVKTQGALVYIWLSTQIAAKL